MREFQNCFMNLPVEVFIRLSHTSSTFQCSLCIRRLNQNQDCMW